VDLVILPRQCRESLILYEYNNRLWHLASLLPSCISLQGMSGRSYHEIACLPSDRTYLVSSAIDTYYYTQMIGDAKKPPTLLASSSFNGFAVIGT